MLKPILEDELIDNMQHELVKVASNQDYSQLETAADYLHSAMQILDDTGFQKQADKILNILYKIAAKEKHLAQELPSLTFFQSLDRLGYPIFKLLTRAHDTSNEFAAKKAKLKLNVDIRTRNKLYLENILDRDATENDYKEILEDLYMPLNAVRYEIRFAPSEGIPRMTVKEMQQYQSENPENKNITSIKPDIGIEVEEPLNPFKTQKIAAKRRPKDPTKVSDSHTKNLTPKKMVQNLKEHGTMFNMKDLNFADDILDAEIEFEDEE